MNAKIEAEFGHTETLYVFWAVDIFAVYSTIRSTIVTGSKFISLGYIICFETGFTPVTCSKQNKTEIHYNIFLVSADPNKKKINK